MAPTVPLAGGDAAAPLGAAGSAVGTVALALLDVLSSPPTRPLPSRTAEAMTAEDAPTASAGRMGERGFSGGRPPEAARSWMRVGSSSGRRGRPAAGGGPGGPPPACPQVPGHRAA